MGGGWKIVFKSQLIGNEMVYPYTIHNYIYMTFFVIPHEYYSLELSCITIAFDVMAESKSKFVNKI